MDQKAIFKLCKDLGCCDGCALRYIGVRNPKAYENITKYSLHFKQTEKSEKIEDNQENPVELPAKEPTVDATNIDQSETTDDKSIDQSNPTNDEHNIAQSNGEPVSSSNGSHAEVNGQNGDEAPPAKRRKMDICVSCLGLLQEECWPDVVSQMKEMMDKKQYDCKSFACALSAPIATILRETVITLWLKNSFPTYNINTITPLKEAWKWGCGARAAAALRLALHSGASAALLTTVSAEYPEDLQECEVLKTLSPSLFAERGRQRRRFTVEFTRRSVEQALEGATLDAVKALPGWGSGIPAASARAGVVSVQCSRDPLYLAGRYIKLSRELPQTPWLVGGRRVMDSSVQEIICEPLATMLGMSPADAEHRLKLAAAGREDVDVRCLGRGRPFAIEIIDPRRELTPEELQTVCDQISSSGKVVIKQLVYVTREDLSILKAGEETKCKTYEALCIKISHAPDEDRTGTPIVRDEDITRINTYRNTPPDSSAAVVLAQRTPVRVLHRRPLLTRTREIIEMHAEKVAGHPQLFALRLRTSAGAYVKEYVHGELGRTAPGLAAARAGRADLLALDVSEVHLDWPIVRD